MYKSQAHNQRNKILFGFTKKI